MPTYTAIYDRCLPTAEEAAAALRSTLGLQSYDNPTDNSDDALAFLVKAAKRQADRYCQNDFLDSDGEDADIPEDVTGAVLMLAARWFMQRVAGMTDNKAGDLQTTFAAATGAGIPEDIKAILFPYRNVKAMFGKGTTVVYSTIGWIP